MAVFNDFELTNAGINLLGQVSTGQPLIFTKIKLGDGNFIGNVKYLTDLFSTFKEVGVSDIVIQEDDSINIKSEFSNDGFSTSKEWKEVGIFAKAGETGTEVLYSYSYALLTVETIPAETTPYRRDLNFRNYISDVTNVTYAITIQKDKYDFDSDIAMQSASYLVEGDRVNVWKDDSCQKRRVAIANDNGMLLNNGLYANLILDIQGKALAYQKPLDSIYGSITAENGRLYTSGAFNNITRLDKASVLEYGDSKIITTPDNSFNAIVEGDKLYVGPSYKNIKPIRNENNRFTLKGEYYEANFLAGESNIGLALGYSESSPLKADTDYTFTIEIISIIGELDNFEMNLRGTTFTNNISKYDMQIGKNVLQGKTKVSLEDYAYSVMFKLSTSPLTEDTTIKFRWQVVEGTEEKPIIPLQYTFPTGALKWDGTENMNFDDYSYIMKGVYGNTDCKGPSGNYYSWFIGADSNVLRETGAVLSPEKSIDVVYSKNYRKPYSNPTVDNAYPEYDKVIIGSKVYRGIEAVTQFLSYNSSLTQTQLEEELAKNLYIEGKVDIISKIQSNMKVGAALGKRPQGNIRDNTGNTMVGDIWYDEANEKYYECKIATDENFIDLTKWEERSVDSAYDRGSLGIANASTAQTKANSAYTLAFGKEPAFTKNSGFNRPTSSSVTSTSTTTVADSAAVKTAYDKGVSAYTLANNKLNTSDLVDVPENSSTKALSAKGGKYLDDKIDNLEFTSLLSENGYQKLPSGLIIQWGKIKLSSSTGTVSFNVPFTSECFNISTTDYGSGGPYATRVNSVTKTDFNVTSTTNSDIFYWQAIGY